MRAGPPSHPYVYRGFIKPGGDRVGWGEVALNPMLQFVFAMPTAASDAGYTDYIKNQFYRLPSEKPEGAEPSLVQKNRFFNAWNTFGLMPPGTKFKDAGGGTPDKDPVISVTDGVIEVRVPIEIPVIPDQKGDRQGFARGRLVIACTDPALLELLKQLKSSADPAQGTITLPAELRTRLDPYKDRASSERWNFTWRVVRVESNMEPIPIDQRGPGGPGGGGPGGGPGGPGGGPGGPGG
jgi:hypothetical protein